MTTKGVATGLLGVSRVFVSAEVTGDGSEQSTAHGLGDTPTLVIVTITDSNNAADHVIVEGTHTATNCLVTVTNGAIYKILAFA